MPRIVDSSCGKEGSQPLLGQIPILPSQCRAGRALLDMTLGYLSRASNISTVVIGQFERGRPVRAPDIAAIREALERAGVVFVEGEGLGPGVRLSNEDKA